VEPSQLAPSHNPQLKLSLRGLARGEIESLSISSTGSLPICEAVSVDRWMFTVTAILVFVGLVMIFSASR